jgi:adenylate cyclase class 2
MIYLFKNRAESHNSRLSLVKGLETEVKIAVGSFRAFRKQLREAGFRVKHRRVFERNTIFETDPPTLRPSGRIVRLREAGGKCILTYKGPATVAKHKSREEIEFLASDSEAAYTFLTRLGYLPRFIYEKYRTEYMASPTGGIVTLDETPIGLYAELEGTEKWIDSTAKLLGVREADYITSSYGALYLQWCEREGIDPTHMRFR